MISGIKSRFSAPLWRVFIAVAVPMACFAGSTMPPEADQRLAHDILKEMVEIKSGFTTGATTPVADAVAKRLRDCRLQRRRYLHRRSHSHQGQSGGPLPRHRPPEADPAARS